MQRKRKAAEYEKGNHSEGRARKRTLKSSTPRKKAAVRRDDLPDPPRIVTIRDVYKSVNIALISLKR